jgi:hypothetical protein
MMLHQKRFFFEKNLFIATLKNMIKILNQERFYLEKNLFIVTLKDLIKI